MATPSTPFASAAWAWTGANSRAEQVALAILDRYAAENSVFADLYTISRTIQGIEFESFPTPGHVCDITGVAGSRCRSLILVNRHGAQTRCTIDRTLALALWGLTVFACRVSRANGEYGDEHWMGPDPETTPEAKAMLLGAYTMIDIVGGRGSVIRA